MNLDIKIFIAKRNKQFKLSYKENMRRIVGGGCRKAASVFNSLTIFTSKRLKYICHSTLPLSTWRDNGRMAKSTAFHSKIGIGDNIANRIANLEAGNAGSSTKKSGEGEVEPGRTLKSDGDKWRGECEKGHPGKIFSG